MPHSLIDSRSFSVCFVSSLLIFASAVAAAVTMFLIRTSLMRSSKWSSSTIICTKNVESYCFGFLYLQFIPYQCQFLWVVDEWHHMLHSLHVHKLCLVFFFLSLHLCHPINVMTIVYVCGMNFIIPFVFLNITIQTSVIWMCCIETHQ